ncbi:MAG: APC family permease [bacterium]
MSDSNPTAGDSEAPSKPRPFGEGFSLRRFFFGAPKNPLDPKVFHSISLIAFFAWVGLGADGLSSSSYGPEEAFLALGEHRYLAIYLAIATAITVAIISACYIQLIQLFPHGGGGYLVVSKLLGERAGTVAGSALVVDYILTIAISVASGVDALLSFLPPEVRPYKLIIACTIIVLLSWANLRGVKESVKILFPIFMLFVITHAALLIVGIAARGDQIQIMVEKTAVETHAAFEGGAFLATLLLLLRAYCIGGGTYTGIEAVSTSVGVLREPRAKTGRNTMIAMAISLAVTASGLLILYLLYGVEHEPGRTLNASLIEKVSANWQVGGLAIGGVFLILALISEGALLFVASQSGFVAGPRVLAAMAVDGWIPRLFAYLSDQLVTQHGVLFMGVFSLVMLFITGANVKDLVILYSVNVFVGFSLSLLGLSLHWWRARASVARWGWKLALSSVGTALTSLVLIFNLVFKFTHGAWKTVILTGALIFVCSRVRAHYAKVARHVKDLDSTLANLPPSLLHPPKASAIQKGPAIMLVGRYGGLGVHCLLSVLRLYRELHDRYIFISVGEIDSSRFKGKDEVKALEVSTAAQLDKYQRLARSLGLESEVRYELATDPIPALERICLDAGRGNPRSIVYAGQLVFQSEATLSRFLHNQAAYSLQRRLVFQGQQMMILPIRVWEPKKRDSAKEIAARRLAADAARAQRAKSSTEKPAE